MASRSPCVILLVVAIVMTVVATRTRFGRYVFATGGNPDAAELSPASNTQMADGEDFRPDGRALTAIASGDRVGPSGRGGQ